METLLELMHYHKAADQTAALTWRSPKEWADLCSGGDASAGMEGTVRLWLDMLIADGVAEKLDRGEGVVLYRAALA